MNTLTANSLKDLLKDHPELIIIDTRLKQDFECVRIPGSASNCVFEIDFDDRMQTIAPDKSQAVCVYGAAADSSESKMAAEKLQRAGYQQIYELETGLSSWKASGFETEGFGGQSPEGPSPLEGERSIDIEQSHLEWTGRNLSNKHWGTLKFKSGVLRFRNNVLVEGQMVIDMHSIANLNLEANQGKHILEDHLKSHDFFDVTHFPEATLTLKEAQPVADAKSGSPNLNITGTLTMKGITDELTFAATTGVNAEGQWIAQAHFDFDRTRWNVIYGSGKFFRNLGMQLKVVA